MRGENFAPCGKVSVPSFEFSEGRHGDPGGNRDLGLGEGLAFPEFPQLGTEAVWELFLYLETVATGQKRNTRRRLPGFGERRLIG
jgi:hypothetical protein